MKCLKTFGVGCHLSWHVCIILQEPCRQKHVVWQHLSWCIPSIHVTTPPLLADLSNLHICVYVTICTQCVCMSVSLYRGQFCNWHFIMLNWQGIWTWAEMAEEQNLSYLIEHTIFPYTHFNFKLPWLFFCNQSWAVFLLSNPLFWCFSSRAKTNYDDLLVMSS